ncbi:hypothetical protein [Nonomuraea sp. NPDC050310]|uniref:hypothetical protein n=1 Tax=Nonomuraea sp. NPDC050310 TaxID=3154935 RepID=UPI0033FEA830
MGAMLARRWLAHMLTVAGIGCLAAGAGLMVPPGLSGLPGLVPVTQVPSVQQLRVIQPPAAAVPLPEAGVASPGELLYSRCRELCPTYLVTTAGDQYVVPGGEGALEPTLGEDSGRASVLAGSTRAGLSPDGWRLALTVRDGLRLVDLRSGATVLVPRPADAVPKGELQPWTWSDDSLTLQLRYPLDPEGYGYLHVSVADGAVQPVHLRPGDEPVGVLLPSREPLFAGQPASVGGRVPIRLGYGRREVGLEVRPGAEVAGRWIDRASVRAWGDWVYGVVVTADGPVSVVAVSGPLRLRVPLEPADEVLGIEERGVLVRQGKVISVVGETRREDLTIVPEGATVKLPGAR